MQAIIINLGDKSQKQQLTNTKTLKQKTKQENAQFTETNHGRKKKGRRRNKTTKQIGTKKAKNTNQYCSFQQHQDTKLTKRI